MVHSAMMKLILLWCLTSSRLQSAEKIVIRVVSDDTDVFVLLIYWVHRAALQCKVQMEGWNGTVLDINATCAELWAQVFATT